MPENRVRRGPACRYVTTNQGGGPEGARSALARSSLLILVGRLTTATAPDRHRGPQPARVNPSLTQRHSRPGRRGGVDPSGTRPEIGTYRVQRLTASRDRKGPPVFHSPKALHHFGSW